MNQYTEEELKEALKVVTSSIRNCEKMHPKFAEGTSQNTLLKNRIKALYISKFLIEDENIEEKYTKEELEKSIALTKMIKAMYVSKSLITNEISKRD